MAHVVIIDQDVLKEMQTHALVDFPNECVGFFYGGINGKEKQVTEYLPLQNRKDGDQRRRFEVHPLDYIKAERHALDVSKVLLGVYHSHPLHPAEPSVYDLEQAMPFFSYIISSVTDTKVEKTTSWQLNEEKNEFEEEILLNN